MDNTRIANPRERVTHGLQIRVNGYWIMNFGKKGSAPFSPIQISVIRFYSSDL